MNDSPPASQTRKVVTCGDAAADMVVAAGLAAPEDLLVLHDVLSVGPLAGCRQARSWVPGREAFWSRVGRAPASFPDKPRDLFTALAGRHPPSELVLAGACGASDVLFLAAVPAWLRLQGGTAPRLSLVRLTRSPEGEVLQSLPWLRPETLRAGWSPKPLSERFTQVLDQAWIAVTDPEPLRIAALATATLLQIVDLVVAFLKRPSNSANVKDNGRGKPNDR